jgi:uncharacterized protein YaaW (UPF0174 family)
MLGHDLSHTLVHSAARGFGWSLGRSLEHMLGPAAFIVFLIALAVLGSARRRGK